MQPLTIGVLGERSTVWCWVGAGLLYGKTVVRGDPYAAGMAAISRVNDF
jgi:hypothetical protein